MYTLNFDSNERPPRHLNGLAAEEIEEFDQQNQDDHYLEEEAPAWLN